MTFGKSPKSKDILENYAAIKEETPDFESISLYRQHKDHTGFYQVLEEQTLSDLDFDNLFFYLDRTQSVIGQQMLYDRITCIEGKEATTQRLEEHILRFQRSEFNRKKSILTLQKLNKRGAYFIQRLIFKPHLEKPKWFKIIPYLSLSPILFLIGCFFYTPLFLLLLLILGVNVMIHFWNKSNILEYANTIPQIARLSKTAQELKQIYPPENPEVWQEAFQKIKNTISKASFLKWESNLSDDIGQIGDFFMDLIKGLFLIEPILFFSILKKLDSQRDELHLLFRYVGEIDMAISIDSVRQDLPKCCIPEFSSTAQKWSSTGMFHPLISDPVANDLTIIDGKSLLISGSNMSGKTTFIRTLAINALLAQTINTACASSFKIPKYRIHSAIRIADDLMNDTSYYYQEVKAVKRLIAESKSNLPNLILLDELFKGTNTIERVASGKAVLSYLHCPNNLVAASTHDLELMNFLQEEYAFYHFAEHIKDNELIFDYQLKSGQLNQTNAIRILEINDFPASLTTEAKSIAARLRSEKE